LAYRAFHRATMSNLRSGWVSACFGVLAFGALTISCAAAAAEQNPAPAKPAGGQAGQAPTAELTPKEEATVDPVAEATATAVAATCKKTVADIGSSGPAGLQSLSEEKRSALLRGPAATSLFMCLATAGDNTRYCDPLPEPGKTDCAERVKLARELKAMPKESVKAYLIHRSCLASSAKADCEKVKEAMTAGSATPCAGLSNASMRDFCTALATGDPGKCAGLSDGAERAHCEAYASDDPGRCPEDSRDCRNLTRAAAALKKQGLEGLQDIDPAVAAARRGKQACAPLLADLEEFCRETR
jgi:hypothetical protein